MQHNILQAQKTRAVALFFTQITCGAAYITAANKLNDNSNSEKLYWIVSVWDDVVPAYESEYLAAHACTNAHTHICTFLK